MEINRLTQQPTESDLESRIHGTVTRIFPWINSDSIRHQLRFAIRLGRSSIEVDSQKLAKAEGRLDILISDVDTPLAILELKRESVALSADDELQGLSYARVLYPSPPLVIVTNGHDTRLLASHDGSHIDPSNFGADQLGNLISAASTIATGDLKRAIEVLLGRRGNLWVDAIRTATTNTITDMSGTWDDYLQPFVHDFLIPRSATQDVLSKLKSEAGPRVTIIEGAPLSGKSSVIREVAAIADQSKELCMLFVEADSTSEGVFQRLANQLSDELNWPATSDEIRQWLRGISDREDGPILVIAIDGNRVTSDQVRKDVDEIVSGYGPRLRILLGLDDTQTDSILLNETRRKKTKIGRNSEVITLDFLDENEFASACEILDKLGMRFIPGAKASVEYRTPWLLRAAAAVARPRREENLVAALQPFMGLDLITNTRLRFSDVDLRSGYRKLAKCILKEAQDKNIPSSLVLEALTTFVVRAETLKGIFSYEELCTLKKSGAIKQTIHSSGEDVIIARIPEAMAAELASVLADRLAKLLESNKSDAAKWLIEISSRLPMGDVVAAQAIFDLSKIREGVPLTFLNDLLQDKPREEPVKSGFIGSMLLPGVGAVNLQFNEDRSVIASFPGMRSEKLELSPEDRDEMSMQVGGQGWLVLSHLVGFQLLAIGVDGQPIGSATPALMLEIGSCPTPLMRPSTHKINEGFFTHDIDGHGTIVCHRSGIVEPITLALLNAIIQMDLQVANDWIEEAIRRDSFPLLARLDIALRQISQFNDEEKSLWAKQTLGTIIKPVISSVLGSEHVALM